MFEYGADNHARAVVVACSPTTRMDGGGKEEGKLGLCDVGIRSPTQLTRANYIAVDTTKNSSRCQNIGHISGFVLTPLR